jgi:hypothetical protein
MDGSENDRGLCIALFFDLVEKERRAVFGALGQATQKSSTRSARWRFLLLRDVREPVED